MLVYMLGRIQGDVEHHGVRPQPEAIADLLIEDLAGEPELRRRVPELLQALRDEGAVIEVGGDWRLQTKESAEWEQAFRGEEKARLADQAGIARVRRDLLGQAIGAALSGTASVPHGRCSEPRKIQRLLPDEKPSGDGIVLRLHNGWEVDLAQTEKEIAAAPPTDATIHLLVPRHQRADELARALVEQQAAEAVIAIRGVPQTNEGKEARAAMESRAATARRVGRRDRPRGGGGRAGRAGRRHRRARPARGGGKAGRDQRLGSPLPAICRRRSSRLGQGGRAGPQEAPRRDQVRGPSGRPGEPPGVQGAARTSRARAEGFGDPQPFRWRRPSAGRRMRSTGR